MWEEKNNTLYKKFEFSDFSEAFSFMTRVAMAAEKMDTVTEKDRKLAAIIDKLTGWGLSSWNKQTTQKQKPASRPLPVSQMGYNRSATMQDMQALHQWYS